MTKTDKQKNTTGDSVLNRVDQFLASSESREAVARSSTAVDSAIASMEKAERVDAETLKLTVTV